MEPLKQFGLYLRIASKYAMKLHAHSVQKYLFVSDVLLRKLMRPLIIKFRNGVLQVTLLISINLFLPCFIGVEVP